MKWVDEIRNAFQALGGAARYEELYEYISRTTDRELTPKWKATVRRTIEDHSSDSENFRAADVFEHLDRGFWALRGENISSEFLLARASSDPHDVVEMVLVREHWRTFPNRSLTAPQTLTISHADASPFAQSGLRAFFEYRDLGINTATQGDIGAQVIRAVPGEASAGAWHSHDLTFQMVYVTKGWVEFEYAGHGKVVMRAGSLALQPPNIVHRLVRNSDDMELLEITAPAVFETKSEGAPE